MDAAKTITANFAQDLNDTDGDGLTNYDELVTHGTKADDNDTDDDGLLDNEEIQIGTNPNSSDATLASFINEKAAANEAAAKAAGIAAVKADPTSFGLALMEVLENVGNTPHTNEWYYQPEWGWMWTNSKTFPYVYLTGKDGRDNGWLYFREGSATPIYFFDYTSEEWLTLGE